MPLFRDGLLNGKFGGILLDSGISLPEDRNNHCPLPPQYKAGSSQTRKVFRSLVRTQREAAAAKRFKKIADVPAHILVGKWEEEVMRFAMERGVIGESEQQT